MYFMDFQATEAIMTMCVQEAHQQAEICRLRRQIASRQQTRQYKLGCRLLSCLGRQLVMLGEWLEQYDATQPTFGARQQAG